MIRYFTWFVRALCLAIALSPFLKVWAEDDPYDPGVSVEWYFADVAFGEDGRIEGGVLVRMAEKWHTYAPEPGDVGAPPHIEVRVPDGVTLAGPEFPPAEAFEEAAGIAYGYDGAVLMRFVLQQTGEALPEGEGFEVALDMLFCRDICVAREFEINVRWPDGQNQAEVQRRWFRALALGGWLTPDGEPILTNDQQQGDTP